MPLKFDIPHFIKVDIGRSSRYDENNGEPCTLRTSSLSGVDIITEEYKLIIFGQHVIILIGYSKAGQWARTVTARSMQWSKAQSSKNLIY
jgi:hypothetical protein